MARNKSATWHGLQKTIHNKAVFIYDKKYSLLAPPKKNPDGMIIFYIVSNMYVSTTGGSNSGLYLTRVAILCCPGWCGLWTTGITIPCMMTTLDVWL